MNIEFKIGDHVRAEIPLTFKDMIPLYVKGVVTKDLGDKLQIDIADNKDWTLYMLREYYKDFRRDMIGNYEEFSIKTFTMVRLPQALFQYPKNLLRPARVLVCEEEYFAPYYEAKKTKVFRKEIGYYGSIGKNLGHSFESHGQYGFLQDTFEKLMRGEVEERETRNKKYGLIHYSKRYFTPETIEFYNKNK